ncbi:hypothetical protein L4D09_00385 [Photobacterium makurazakiensis]|uniref:hypothetical protein n=1 Tax=Photobacterium makurazakiensis TaxID=2910234 RepID=UPI003D1150DE
MTTAASKPVINGMNEAIDTIYTTFPNLSYKPRPDDVKLLAAYIKSQKTAYPAHLDILLSEENRHIEQALKKYHNINKI